MNLMILPHQLTTRSRDSGKVRDGCIIEMLRNTEFPACLLPKKQGIIQAMGECMFGAAESGEEISFDNMKAQNKDFGDFVQSMEDLFEEGIKKLKSPEAQNSLSRFENLDALKLHHEPNMTQDSERLLTDLYNHMEGGRKLVLFREAMNFLNDADKIKKAEEDAKQKGYVHYLLLHEECLKFFKIVLKGRVGCLIHDHPKCFA